jgi:hypothetical protein
LLQEGTASSQQIHELLGFCGSAHRPQTASVATGQDEAKAVFLHILGMFFPLG